MEVLQVSGGVFEVAGWIFDTPATDIPEIYFFIMDTNVGLYLNNLITLGEFATNTASVPQNYVSQYYVNFQSVTMTYCPSCTIEGQEG